MRLITGLSFVKIFKDALDYAKQFDKAIVDIAIVTQQSADSAREMGKMYRELANDLNVSSVDLATAAATIYRQGYTDNQEVSDIITGATKFGAVSDLSTEESIKSMTASLQNFRKEGESAKEIVDRIGDTWSYMGDAVATEGSDIADAMGKASASVASVGLEFERASAYAAVMLARTQQTGEVIGTQLNSLASRYAKVTSTGYKKITSDDEGEALSFNDISAALQKAGIQMYDTVEKTFTPLGEVLDELAPKWDTLDEATQKYIATTMAGTRGMNYFLTLMQSYDQALALEGQAMANRGVVDDKYAIWLQGVEAAQNNLTNSMERFYSVLSANTLTDFYNGLAGIVDIISDATEATDGWNIKLPLAAAGIMGIVVSVAKVIKVLQDLKSVSEKVSKANFISTLFSGNIGLTVGVIAAVATAIGAIIGSIQKMNNETEKINALNEQLDTSTVGVHKWQLMISSIEELGKKSSESAEYHAEFDRIRKEIVSDSPDLQAAYGNEGEKIGDLSEALKIATDNYAAFSAQQKLSLMELAESNKEKYTDSYRSIVGDVVDAEQIRGAWGAYEPSEGVDSSDIEYALKYWLRDIEKFGDVSSNSLVALYEYKNIISEIMSGEAFKDMKSEGNPLANELETFLNEVNLMIDSKIEDLYKNRELLRDTLFGIAYSDAGAYSVFEGNHQALDDIIGSFLRGSLNEMSPDELFSDFENYVSLMADAMTGAWNETDLELAEGLAEKLKNLGVDTASIDEYINEWMAAYNYALKNNTSFGADFADALMGGDFSFELIQRFNEAAQEMDNLQGTTLMQKILNGAADAFEWLGVSAQEAEEKIVAFDWMTIYQDLAMAKQEANGFADILAKLGTGEGKFDNIHEAVYSTAESLLSKFGVTDEKSIAAVSEELLSGLYSTYPDIVDFVDITTGALVDGWGAGVKEAVNIWNGAIEEMKISTALKQAEKDMIALADSNLWTSILSSDGKGLFGYAEDWAKAITPDGTTEEVHSIASQFVDLFFDTFEDIDAAVIDASGKIIPGMQTFVDSLRKTVYEAEYGISKLQEAYENVSRESKGRNDAFAGLNNMIAANRTGSRDDVLSAFEGMSSEGISVLISIMPELITRLNEGTYSTHDLYEAIYRLNEELIVDGKNAWKDYFNESNPAFASENMAASVRHLVQEMDGADDKVATLYTTLQKMSDGGTDISSLLEQYGSLLSLFIRGEMGAEDLYAAIERMLSVEQLQRDIENVASLSEALTTINPMNENYSSSEALSAYEDLESEYSILKEHQRGSEEYLATAKDLVDETTQSVYEEAAAYGVVLDSQAEAMRKAQEEQQAMKEYVDSIRDIASPLSVAQKATNKLISGMRLESKELEDIIDAYPELADEMLEYADNTEDATKLIKALNKAQSDRAIQKWADDLSSALNTLDNATEGTYEYDKALTALGDVFGSGLGNLDSLSFAAQNLDNIRAAANGSAEAFRALQEAAFVNIVGTSQADFSAVLNGIKIVSDNSIAMAEWLASLGLFTVETVQTTSYQEIIDGITGATVPVQANGTYRILKPMSTNPFKAKTTGGSSGSSGGGGSGGSRGGGGGGSISVSDKTSKMVEGMEKANEAFENRKSIMELRKEYHEIRGEIQGVIGYTKEEAKILEEQNKVLEQNVSALEAEIKTKEAALAKNKSSSKTYKQAAVDLDELNEAHKEYTEALLENKNRLEEIQKEIEEFNEDARQATITVQDLIRETLEAQDEFKRDVLDGTVDLEDEILDILTARYEKEQELLIETAEAKQEAIQAEIDAIDELIEAREKLIQKEEQEQEIAELEAKIARISADPTRRKELLQLQEELADKRKDMAWDTYQEELEAQKESLEDQITSLDDYIDYVNNYYEELFENPKKLIAEMEEIIKMSDQEIIDWLSANQEEFLSYSENKKEQTVQNWQEMIDSMRGVTETYRDEIEEIMSWTDAEIMDWLKKNNIEFQNATKEQQDSFLHSWKQTLEEWRNAYKEVTTDVSAPTYTSGSSSGGGSGGGGGGGGGGSYGGSSTPKSYSSKAAFKYKLKGGGWSGDYSSSATSTVSQANATLLAATSALNKVKKAASDYYKQALAGSPTGVSTATKKINDASVANPGSLLKRAYKTGGLAYETGPAWLDGTMAKPERVLSAYQTQLFEDLLATLHTIKTLSVSGITSMKSPEMQNAYGSGLTIEQVSITVEKLNDDADYEEMAMKVGDVLKKEMLRVMPSGGIII